MTLLRRLRTPDRGVSRSGAVRRVLVDSRTPVNYEMVAPVLRLMADDERVQFSCTASEAAGSLDQIYADAPLATRRLGPGRAALSKWDAYLASDFMWATLPRGAGARIQMFHGVGGKYGFDAPTESMRQWHRLFFVNERRLRNFVRAGAIDPGSPAACLIGMPKVDYLVDGSMQRDPLLEQFGLDPSRPTVLYAPTWSPASSLNHLGVAFVERLVTMPINVIVKLHDRSCDLRARYSGGVDWKATLGPILDRPNALLATSANITPCLVAADVMVTDHSSCGFEYLLLDRPLVRIDMPQLIELANVHPDYVELLAGTAHNVRGADGAAAAAAAVERALGDPDALSASRQAVAADLFYRPGTAAARCAAALYDVLGLAAHPSVTSALSAGEPCLRSA
jgi:hypothetical protein